MQPQPRTQTAASGTSSWSTRSVRVPQRWVRSRWQKHLCCRRRRLLYRPSHFTCSPNPIDRRLWDHCPSQQRTVASLFGASMGPTVKHSVTLGPFIRNVTWSVWVLAQRMGAQAMETMFTSFSRMEVMKWHPTHHMTGECKRGSAQANSPSISVG